MRRKAFSLATVLSALVLGSLVLASCGDDDDGTGPEPITLASFAGAWECSTFTVMLKANPQVSYDLVALGGVLNVNVQSDGSFTGQARLPTLEGGFENVPVQGTFVLVDQQTVTIRFTPEIPPFFTEDTMAFTLVGDVLDVADDDTSFDLDGVDEPATLVAQLLRV